MTDKINVIGKGIAFAAGTVVLFSIGVFIHVMAKDYKKYHLSIKNGLEK